MKIGKTYRLKDGTLARLQTVSRCISKGTLDGSVRHYVQLFFQDLVYRDSYIIKVPFDVRLEPDSEIIPEIIEAIVNGTQVPQASPHDLIKSSQSP